MRSSSSACPIDSCTCSASCSLPRTTVWRPVGHAGAERSSRTSSRTRAALPARSSASMRSQPPRPTSPPCALGKERTCSSSPSTAIAWMPPPHSTRSCVHAAPSLDANAEVWRRRLDSAAVCTMRSSPCRPASAATSSSSRSSSGIPNGSISHGPLQCPRAGASGVMGRSAAAGIARATRRAAVRARSAPSRVASRVAANPQAPPTRTRTPMPSPDCASTRSTCPLRISRCSSSVLTWRASA